MMSGIRLLLSAVALIASFCIAMAQEEEAEVDCGNSTAQLDLNDCGYRTYEAEDALLNAQYRKAMAKARQLDIDNKGITPYLGSSMSAADALKSAQRAWIGYRDGHCVLAGYEARGRQAEPLLVSGCLAELTRKRTAELKEFLEGE